MRKELFFKQPLSARFGLITVTKTHINYFWIASPTYFVGYSIFLVEKTNI